MPVHLDRRRRRLRLFSGLGVALVAAVAALPISPASGAPAEFSLARAMHHVRVVADGPHPTGTPANEAVRLYLSETLTRIGLQPQTQKVTIARDWGTVASSGYGNVFSGTAYNVIARIPGTATTGALLLMAHYDSVATSPGAGDDASGVAALLEAARVLSAHPVRNDVILLLTDGHELGTLGAEGFRRRHRWAQDVRFVINLEARGGGGRPVLFQLRGNSPWAISAYAAAAPRPLSSSALTGLADIAPAGTDFSNFRDARAGGLDFSLPDHWPRYHTARDSADRIDPRSVEHQGRTALRLAQRFASLDLHRAPTRTGAVFFTVPWSSLLWYPAALVMPLLLLCTGLGALLLLRSRERRPLRPAGTLAEAARLLGAVLVTAVAGELAIGGYHLLSRHGLTLPLGGTYAWRPAAAGVGAVAVGGGLAVMLAGGTRSRGERVAGALLGWWLVTAVTSVALPGASYLFLWPLLAAQLGLLAVRVAARFGHRGPRWWLALLPALVAGVTLVLPAAGLFALVLGPQAYVAGACSVLLLSGPAVALVPSAVGGEGAGRRLGSRLRLGVPLAFVGAGVIVLAIHAVTTRPSTSYPRTDHLTYWLDADRSEASWLSLDRAPDPWTRRHLGNQPVKRSLRRYLPTRPDREVLVAAAPEVTLAPPQLEVLQDRTSGRRRTVRLRVSSPRGAPTLRLFVTSGTPVREAVVAGTVLRYPRPAQSWWLKASTVPEAGIEVTLTVTPGSPLSLLLADTSPGLPLPVVPRPASLMSYAEPIMPEDSSVFVARRFSLGPGDGGNLTSPPAEARSRAPGLGPCPLQEVQSCA